MFGAAGRHVPTSYKSTNDRAHAVTVCSTDSFSNDITNDITKYFTVTNAFYIAITVPNNDAHRKANQHPDTGSRVAASRNGT